MMTERLQVGAPLSFTEKFRFPIWKIDRVEIISLYAAIKNAEKSIMDYNKLVSLLNKLVK